MFWASACVATAKDKQHSCFLKAFEVKTVEHTFVYEKSRNSFPSIKGKIISDIKTVTGTTILLFQIHITMASNYFQSPVTLTQLISSPRCLIQLRRRFLFQKGGCQQRIKNRTFCQNGKHYGLTKNETKREEDLQEEVVQVSSLIACGWNGLTLHVAGLTSELKTPYRDTITSEISTS